MNNSDTLVWYGIFSMIVCGCFIVIPYWRGKTDLLTAWNVLLLSVGMWTGFGCLEVHYGEWPWETLQWFQPSRHEMQWYMVTNSAFIATLLACYYYNPLGKKLAANRLRKWPPLNSATYFFVLSFCAAVLAGSVVFGRGNFLGLVFFQLSHKAVIFASVFSFILWYRDRINLAWLGLFIGVFVIAAVFSMMVSGGRRMLLSVFLGPVLCFYWYNARHWKVRNTMLAMTVAAVGIVAVSFVYSSIRWYNRGPEKQERTASSVIIQLKSLRHRQGLFQNLLANKINYFSQNNVNYAMLTKRYVDTGRLTVKPLNTLAFVLAYPIPRRVWDNKPQPVGIVVPHDASRIFSTNWGVGPAGHAAYEGGILVIMLYAMLAAIGVRFMDDPLQAQPHNPFLISLHAGALPHVACFARGDFGVMTNEIVECFIFAVMLGIGCRLLFGTEQTNVRRRMASPSIRPGMLPTPRQLSPPRLQR